MKKTDFPSIKASDAKPSAHFRPSPNVYLIRMIVIREKIVGIMHAGALNCIINLREKNGWRRLQFDFWMCVSSYPLPVYNFRGQMYFFFHDILPLRISGRNECLALMWRFRRDHYNHIFLFERDLEIRRYPLGPNSGPNPLQNRPNKIHTYIY